jgi:O-antigen ligase
VPWHPYLEPERVRADLSAAAAGDPFGHRLHVILAVLFCFGLGFPTSIVEIAAIPLVGFFFLRTPHIWRTWGSFAVQPVFLAAAAWIAWQVLSLSWSADPRQGFKEISSNRWLWVPWMLWPVMSRRLWLIAAIGAGFLCGNVSQVLQAIGQAAGVPWLTFHRFPDRVSGWWDPVVGGSLLAGVLGVHLGVALMMRGWPWARVLATAGAVITVVAIFATGTRGASFAAAGLVVLSMLLWLALSRRPGGATAGEAAVSRRFRLALLGGIVLVCIIGSVSRAPAIRARFERGWREVESALRAGDYMSDTGKRLLMWRGAVDAVRAHPLRGVGAGGYHRWAAANLRGKGIQHAEEAVHAHAHSAPLHIAATTGLVGLGLFSLMIGLALRGAIAEAGRENGLGWAPALGIAGLLLAGLFDPVQLNAQTAALLFTLMAFCMRSRPPIESGPLFNGDPR